jgi:hypothetical protein
MCKIRQISGKLIPRQLRTKEKENCLFITLDLPECAINYSFLTTAETAMEHRPWSYPRN